MNNVRHPEPQDDSLRLKRALVALKRLQSRLDTLESARTAPIAIIGTGCRFPGADNPEAFWRLLHEGRDAIGEVPASRWDVAKYCGPDPRAAGTIASRCGGFVADVDLFDAPFFGIAPREAVSLDPQQRLLLEVSWEALEQAGVAPDRLTGSATGVFVGISSNDFAQSLMTRDPRDIDHHMGSGNARSVAAGRLSYVLGLKGPSLAIDTACSSSLVAVHLACESLRRRECDLALAGGVNVLFSPEVSISHSRAQMLAPDGRCKTFDASADGFVRAEGCGIVVLKRLDAAIADRDNVLALILGSALNHDGRTSALTVPSGPSQEGVIRAALANAGVGALDVSYVEAHGTGTRLGDPIEVAALAAVLCEGRSNNDPLILGSVKTNIGHLEAAAGIAGLLKVVLALKQQEIPAHLHFRQPNPLISWEYPIHVPAAASPWHSLRGRRVAGVSSFGFSGTNAHVILAEAPVTAEPDTDEEHQQSDALLVLSAKTESALRTLAGRYIEPLAAPQVVLRDMAYSAATGRSHFAHRLAVTANSTTACRDELNAFLERRTRAATSHGHVLTGERPRIAFLFSGQGSQYPGMSSGLYREHPTFRAALDRCAKILEPWMDRSLTDILFETPADVLNRTVYTQPALFALEYSLAELWKSWAVEPDLVFGHSVGEYVAACVAGVFSLEDGLMLIAARGRLMDAIRTPGEMIAVLADVTQVTAAIGDAAGDVSIAAINGPRNVVLSGARDKVREIAARLAAQNVPTVRLAVSQAFHSPLMDPILADFRAVASRIQYSPPTVDVVSNVSGSLAGHEIATADYWLRHLRDPVRFADGVHTLERDGCDTCVEIGPKPVLLDLARQSFAPGAGTWLASLRPGQPDSQEMLRSLATLYTKGASIDWTRFYADRARRRVALPLYPFERQRYWLEPSRSKRGIHTSADQTHVASHPLLGPRCWVAGSDEVRYQARIAADSPAYLGEHAVFDATIVPASAYVEMALAAGSAFFSTDALVLEHVSFRQALVLDEPKLIQVVLVPNDQGRTTFRVYSRSEAHEDSVAILHASGEIGIAATGRERQDSALERYRAETRDEVRVDWLEAEFANRGIRVGPTFRAIAQLWRSPERALARVEAPTIDDEELTRYHIHPALLDACCRTSGVFSLASPDSDTLLQVGIERLRYYRRPGRRLWASVRVRSVVETGVEQWLADCEIFDEHGALCVVVEGQSARRALRESLERSPRTKRAEQLYALDWVVKPPSATTASPSLADPDRIAESLRSEIAVVSADPQMAAYGTFLLNLDRLAQAYIVEALANMGWVFRIGDRFSTDAIAERLGILPRHLRLFERLLALLAEGGVLTRETDSWEVAAVPLSSDPSELLKRLTDGCPDGSPELSLVRESGQRLVQVLRGTSDPLDFLFPKGEVSRIGELYENTSGAVATHRVLGKGVASALEGWPGDGILRVLEIGAGTGATTASILEVLPPGGTEYTFTDVSPRFLTHAGQRFSRYPFVRYQVLDIEQPPGEQGFPSDHYHLVIATNVLHATRNLRQTIANVRDLLAPGGILILVEGTAPSPWLDLVFGMLEGWWRFADTDLRPSHPLITGEAWKKLLAQEGFLQPAVASADSVTSIALSRQTAIVARRSQIPSPSVHDGGSWLVLADEGGTGEDIAVGLTSAGECGDLIYASDRRTRSSAERAHIETPSTEQAWTLLEELGRAATKLRGVVCLWGLDDSVRDLSAEDLKRKTVGDLETALRLVRTVMKLNLNPPPRLWFVTRDAQAAGRSPAMSGIGSAPLWGIGRVIALEYPEFWGGMIDLSRERLANDASSVVRELLHGDGEDQVAFRKSERLVARLGRRPSPTDRPCPIRADGTYLITGGLGAMALDIAGWLVNQGARHLCLVGRRHSISPAAGDSLRRLEHAGTEIHIVKANVADAAQMRHVFAGLRGRPALRGVVHAAGVPASGDLDHLTPADLESAFAAKISGTWLLHELTRGMALDFFVLCSSMVALWGAKGQGDYVAANAFLDAMAHYRKAIGLPALSINWGPFVGGGMLPSTSAADLSRMGIATTPMAQAGALFGELLRSDAVQVAAVNIDWHLFRGIYEARGRRPLFEQVETASDRAAAAAQRRPVVDELRQAPPSERVRIVRDHVQRTFAGVLGHAPAQVSDPKMGFFNLGMDSLTAMEFRERLESSFGLSLPSTVAIDFSTVETLTAYLLTAIPELEESAVYARPAHDEELSDRVRMLQDLSEEDVEALLLKKLEMIRDS